MRVWSHFFRIFSINNYATTVPKNSVHNMGVPESYFVYEKWYYEPEYNKMNFKHM